MENFNFTDILAQAQAMQTQMQAAQEKLDAAEVTGSAGGGLVSATVKGTGELVSVVIKPEACDPDDTETLGDLVVAAVRDAHAKVGELQSAFMPELPDLSGITGSLPGLGEAAVSADDLPRPTPPTAV